MSNASRIDVNIGKLTFNAEKGIYVAENQKKGSKSIELKQTITTTSFYPSTKYTNSMSFNPLADLMQVDEQEFESSEVRVAWMNVPVDATVELITKMLADNPTMGIQRHLSHQPILSVEDKSAISAGFITMEGTAKKQAVLDGDGNYATVAGKKQYRRNFIVKELTTANQTVDTRSLTEGDAYEFETEDRPVTELIKPEFETPVVPVTEKVAE